MALVVGLLLLLFYLHSTDLVWLQDLSNLLVLQMEFVLLVQPLLVLLQQQLSPQPRLLRQAAQAVLSWRQGKGGSEDCSVRSLNRRDYDVMCHVC